MIKMNDKKVGAVLVQGGGIAGVQAALDLAVSRIIRYSGGELAYAAVIYRDH